MIFQEGFPNNYQQSWRPRNRPSPETHCHVSSRVFGFKGSCSNPFARCMEYLPKFTLPETNIAPKNGGFE